MRFEKITDNKIKIFFSFDDMNKNHISRKILFSNNAFSQNFIQSVLKSAEQNLNFKIENENILIEILNYNDGCVFTVTKVDSNFIENIGNSTLYAEAEEGTYCFLPGERKEIIKENAEKEKPVLPGGDLYPAGIIE